MNIGLISDTHGDLDSFNKALDIFVKNKTEMIMHAGDILNHGVFNPVKKSYDPLDLAEAINNCPIPMIFSKGNCDSDVDTLAIEYPIQSPFAFYQTAGKRLLLLHGDKYKEEQLTEIGAKYDLDFIIRGHTHHYQLKKGKPVVINPGSSSLPKTEDNVPTVGLLSDSGVEIINIDDGIVIDSLNF